MTRYKPCLHGLKEPFHLISNNVHAPHASSRPWCDLCQAHRARIMPPSHLEPERISELDSYQTEKVKEIVDFAKTRFGSASADNADDFAAVHERHGQINRDVQGSRTPVIDFVAHRTKAFQSSARATFPYDADSSAVDLWTRTIKGKW